MCRKSGTLLRKEDMYHIGFTVVLFTAAAITAAGFAAASAARTANALLSVFLCPVDIERSAAKDQQKDQTDNNICHTRIPLTSCSGHTLP